MSGRKVSNKTPKGGKDSDRKITSFFGPPTPKDSASKPKRPLVPSANGQDDTRDNDVSRPSFPSRSDKVKRKANDAFDDDDEDDEDEVRAYPVRRKTEDEKDLMDVDDNYEAQLEAALKASLRDVSMAPPVSKDNGFDEGQMRMAKSMSLSKSSGGLPHQSPAPAPAPVSIMDDMVERMQYGNDVPMRDQIASNMAEYGNAYGVGPSRDNKKKTAVADEDSNTVEAPGLPMVDLSKAEDLVSAPPAKEADDEQDVEKTAKEDAPEQHLFAENDDEYVELDIEETSESEEGSDELPEASIGLEIVQQENLMYPLTQEEQVSAARFRQRAWDILGRIDEWGQNLNTDWYKKRRNQREMSKGFGSALRTTRRQQLYDELLASMPEKSQAVLGRENLSAKDLLDLPEFEGHNAHFLVYVQINARYEEAQITTRKSKLSRKHVKSLKRGVDSKCGTEFENYWGSSVNQLGGTQRVVSHETLINSPADTEESKLAANHKSARRADRVAHFRRVCLIRSPYAGIKGRIVAQDTTRWLPVFYEGFLCVYTNGYIRSRKPQNLSGELRDIFPDVSYDFVEDLRNGLGLPDLSQSSLNRALPWVQGTAGGMVRITQCANPKCARPKLRSKEEAESHYVGTRFFTTSGDSLGPRYCLPCQNFAKKNNGQIRSREGRIGGRFKKEVHNLWVIHKHYEVHLGGDPNKCQNKDCGVEIDMDADIYGLTDAIRCNRCSMYRGRYRRDWTASDEEKSCDAGKCDNCDNTDCSRRLFDKKKLCQQCYARHCSFKDPTKGRNRKDARRTWVKCINPCCASPNDGSLTYFIEDVKKHVWRCSFCDWYYTLFGQEPTMAMRDALITMEKNDIPQGPEQASHHRWSPTQCVDCRRCVSARQWTPASGGFKCGLCDGRSCISGQNCRSNSAHMPILQYADNRGGELCIPCRKQNGAHHEFGAKAKASTAPRPDRVCANCNKVGKPKEKGWAYVGESGLTGSYGDKKAEDLRCPSCARKEKSKTKTPSTIPERKCQGKDCDEMTRKGMYIGDSYGPKVPSEKKKLADFRCIPCGKKWKEENLPR